MHEFSLVKGLLAQVNQVLEEQQAAHARQIRIALGPLSGVEPELVRSAFERLNRSSQWRDTELVITTEPLAIRCGDCQLESELTQFVFQCPACGSQAVTVIRGDAFRLLSITVDEPLEPSEDESDECQNHLD
jgi:hydrogenase nickel incorporation protein HypA/HybF